MYQPYIPAETLVPFGEPHATSAPMLDIAPTADSMQFVRGPHNVSLDAPGYSATHLGTPSHAAAEFHQGLLWPSPLSKGSDTLPPPQEQAFQCQSETPLITFDTMEVLTPSNVSRNVDQLSSLNEASSVLGSPETVQKKSKRGPFTDKKLRQQTAETRIIGSCVRCRNQRIRVSWPCVRTTH